MSAARSRRLALIAGSLLVVAAAASPVLAAEAAVAIKGRTFEPATITVSQGDTVTWTVTESINEPHSVTSGTPEDSGKVFDSGTSGANNSFKLRDTGQTFDYTFDQPGEYLYYCVIHPAEMTGKVVVLAPGASAPPAAEPPPSEVETGVAPERRLVAGSILVISLILMFGMAWLWRRMNPA
jgi:plastocyanin